MKTDEFWSAEGRITRLPYFLRILSLSAIQAVLFKIIEILGHIGVQSPAIGVFLILLYCILVIASIIQAIKRLHDIDKTGWLSLVLLVPLINIILGLYLLFMPGTEGENKYGADPRQLKKQGA